MSIWASFTHSWKSLRKGLSLTFSHALNARHSRHKAAIQDSSYFSRTDGVATIQYPHETIPVPDTGRYQLHNEIDDCIVCDKCANVCPVNCITIEPVRSPEEFGKTSDGTPKRIYAAKFDIDLAKCCFCGLCTTVCPTECLTMTPDFDYSTFRIQSHNFQFGAMSEVEIAQRKTEWERYLATKPPPPSAPARVAVKPKFTSPGPKDGGHE